LSTLGYLALLFPAIDPVASIMIIALGQALLPLITLTCIGYSLPPNTGGIGFGVLEVVDSVFHLAGNLFYGMLYDWSGGYFDSLVVVLVLSVLGVLLLAYIEFHQLVSRPSRQIVEDQSSAYETLISEG
jgi:hypothetical protein